jgi:hypothetical protein
MSFEQILEELPNLSQKERRELGLRLIELEADDDIALSNYVAAEGFASLDQEEREAELREARRSLDC